MAIDNFRRARHSLVGSVYHRAHHDWARKHFEMEVPRRLEIAISNLVFANN